MILFIFRCRPQQMRLPWLSRGSRRWRPAWRARPAWWRQHTEPRWCSCQLCPPEGRRLGTWGLRWCTQCCRRGRVKHWTLPDSFVNCGARRKKHPQKNPNHLEFPKDLRTWKCSASKETVTYSELWESQPSKCFLVGFYCFGVLPHHKFILKWPKLSSFSVVITLLLPLRKESPNTKIKPLRAFFLQCEHLFLIKNTSTPSYSLGHVQLFLHLNASHRRSQISSYLPRAQKYILNS